MIESILHIALGTRIYERFGMI